MPTFSKHLTDALIRVVIFVLGFLILPRQEIATPPKIFTWRLLIRTDDNKKPRVLTVDALRIFTDNFGTVAPTAT